MKSLLNFLFQMLSDTKKELQQEVKERLENITLLTEADTGINLEIENLKNTISVLTNNLHDNAIRFHVETISEAATWPYNTLITYQTKLTDTHNAMNAETGIFTAPFSGTYGFVFYAYFVCESEDRYFFVEHHGTRSLIARFYSSSSNSFISSSIYFLLV